MTIDDIIKLAKRACMIDLWYENPREVERFAHLVRAAALEEAAVVCDEMQAIPASEPRHCAQDIRLLKEKK